MYPEQLLCRQFWSLGQQIKFGENIHKKKLKLYNPLLDHLQKHVDFVLDDDKIAKNAIIDLVQNVNYKKDISRFTSK